MSHRKWISIVWALAVLIAVTITCDVHAQWVDSAALDARMTKIESRVSTLEAKLGIASKPTPVAVKSAVTVTRSHWTHPDTISNHLQSDQHAAEVAAMGVTLVGMSHEQMLTLHDQLHEARNGKTVSRTVTRSTAVPTLSSCPGGVCPVNSSRSVSRSRSGWYPGKALGF